MEGKKPVKVIVPVVAEFDANGRLTPISFVWEDGRRYVFKKAILQ